MLRVVLVNLISNALKFTQPRARAEIEIGHQPAGKANGNHDIRARQRRWFDMKYVDKLFGVFQRLHGVDEFKAPASAWPMSAG